MRRSVFAVVSGAAGLGKTTIAHDFEKQAAARGHHVLHTTCAPVDQERPFSTLRRLLGDTMTVEFPEWPAPINHPASATELHRVSHQMICGLSRLSQENAVVLVVDDIRHADAHSWHCIRQVMDRGSRIVLLSTWDPLSAQAALPALAELVHTTVVRLDLGPLPAEQIASMVAARPGLPGTAPAAEIALTTGGNPLLVQALLGPDGEPGFRRAVLDVVRRTGDRAVRVARAAAVLDESATPSLLSRLSEVDPPSTGQILHCLAEAGVLDGVRFRHPAAGPALLDDIPHAETVWLRHRAAALLHQEGKPSRVIARHLLSSGPKAADWVSATLMDVVRQALAKNETGLALRCLELVSRCVTDGARRRRVRAMTTMVRWLQAPATAAPDLRGLRELAIDSGLSRGLSQAAAQILLHHFRFDDATEILAYLDRSTMDDPARARIRSVSRDLLLTSTYPELAGRLVTSDAAACPSPDDAAPGIWPAILRANRALSQVLTQQATPHTTARAEQVLQDAEHTHSSLQIIQPALLSLVYADMLAPAAEWCNRFRPGPAGHGGTAAHGVIGAISALIAFREGRLDVAVTEATAALGVMGPEWNEVSALAIATLAEAHTAIGSHDRAAELFARPAPAALFDTRAGVHYLHARGRHHLATGRWHAALNDFLACGQKMTRWNIGTPSLAPWREGAAEAWLALGKRAGAFEVMMQPDAPSELPLLRSEGIRLRVLASTYRPAERLPLLEYALKVLQQSGDRYQTARCLTDLSETYQSLGDKPNARTAARRARRLAESCHADKLCRTLVSTNVSAAAEAETTGDTADGKAAALSESERRVAILAAQGFTNREISSKLHVTVSTVEQHLTRVYRKMHIRNREQLPTEFNVATTAVSWIGRPLPTGQCSG